MSSLPRLARSSSTSRSRRSSSTATAPAAAPGGRAACLGGFEMRRGGGGGRGGGEGRRRRRRRRGRLKTGVCRRALARRRHNGGPEISKRVCASPRRASVAGRGPLYPRRKWKRCRSVTSSTRSQSCFRERTHFHPNAPNAGVHVANKQGLPHTGLHSIQETSCLRTDQRSISFSTTTPVYDGSAGLLFTK